MRKTPGHQRQKRIFLQLPSSTVEFRRLLALTDRPRRTGSVPEMPTIHEGVSAPTHTSKTLPVSLEGATARRKAARVRWERFGRIAVPCAPKSIALSKTPVPARYVRDFISSETGRILAHVRRLLGGKPNSQAKRRGTLSLLVAPRHKNIHRRSMTITESCLTQHPVVARTPMYQKMFATAGKLCCRLFHRSISRPVAGRYRCWRCLREFETEW